MCLHFLDPMDAQRTRMGLRKPKDCFFSDYAIFGQEVYSNLVFFGGNDCLHFITFFNFR